MGCDSPVPQPLNKEDFLRLFFFHFTTDDPLKNYVILSRFLLKTNF